MKYNFTESGVLMPAKGYSQQHKSKKDDKVLAFVQKIVNVIGLFFKPKNSHQTNVMHKESMTATLHGQLYAESSLQEYFIDKYPPQINKNKVKNVPDLITNQDLTMNKLSLNSNSTVKEYHLGSHFDEKLKRWTPSFSSPKRIDEDDENPKNLFFKGFATTILLVLISVLGVAAQGSIDLSLRKTINKSLPALNESVKYTLWLKNSGPSTASSIVVQEDFPIGGAVLNTHTGGANFTYSPITGIGTWNVATLAVGDSVSLEINATVTQQGVFFNTAEVISIGANQEDTDSTPNNSKLYEDDIATACFSVPLLWYPGEEYTVSVPAPYKYGASIKWFNGTTEITPSSTVAVVNADSSLTIKAPGTFTFTTNVTSCPAQGCCAVQVVEGPYGSIGDYVWQDTNNDGKQGSTTTEPPVAGVKVYLLSATGTKLDSTTTNSLGKYLFDSLTTDSYRVQFVKPIGYDSFTTQNSGTDDTKDSDAGTTGLSQLINIDTSKLPADTLRNNPNIDAGLKPNYGSIGDYVWSDVNNNGQQDSGEAPIAGVKVYLLSASGTKLDSTTTNSLGKYVFDTLASGTYKIQFVAPAGSIAAKQNTGADVSDSDANKNGMSQLITINTTKLPADTLRNNPQIDAGFVPVGSIGDYVFADNNGDGIQNTGDSPVAGIKVYLLDATTGAKLDSTVTNGAGKYLFDSLLAGSYKVKFVLPAGSEATGKLLGGDTTKDSNINPDGSTDAIVIDTTQPLGSTARNNTTIDAGIKTAFGSIGDYVWSDVNNNGQQDSGEAPIAGVKVYLLSASGTKLDSTVTNSLGKYVFDTLASGTYKIQFVAPAGSIAAKQNTGADVTDSDANKNGISQLITINTTKLATDTLRNNPQIDAGFVPVGSIGDYVFADNNGDGIQNTGDSPVAGIKVYLLDATTGAKLDSTVTNGAGKYLFDSLLAGNYKVKFVLPAGSEATGKLLGGDTTKDSNINPDGSTDAIVIDTTQPLGSTARNNTTIDAGIKTAFGSIGDYVWSDVNNNGQQDSGEAPIAGVKVYLLSATGTKLDSTTTNSLGKYVFDTLASGTYKIQFVAPAGSIAAKQNTGADVSDSDANKNGMSQLITINTTKLATDTLRNNPQIDAGFVPVGSIGDYVFADNNGDGIQNTGDSPVAGIKVYLLDATTGAKLDSAITDINGKYLFDSLLNGNYKVKFVIPAGSTITGKTLGGDPTKDSDANPDGTTDVISINTSLPVGNVGRNNTTVDAGIKTAFGSIGDYVWNDSNNNGLQDSAETGVSGVIVELYASDAIGLPIGAPLKKDTTDAGGKYLFTGLPAGNYVVKVVTSSLPSGSQLTSKQDVGTNDAIDSDFNPSTGLSDKIVIDPYTPTKKDILTVDGGIYSPLGSIGDFVWKDTNNNGLQDTGEVGVEGVKLELYASDALGNPVGAAINTTTTNASGFYTFNNLPKGDYVVRIVTSTLPATYSLSTKVNAGDDTKDSDFNATSGYSPKISIDPLVPALKDNPTIDGAIYLPVVCSELVAIAVDADICSGDTTSIRGTITGGGTVRWYLTPIGGTPIATTNSGAAYTIFPTTTTVYYAEIANAPAGCPNTRQPVAVVVNVRPANPSCVGAVEECIGKTINLNNFIINTVTTPGGSFEWHTTANPSSPLVVNPTAVGDGTYYLFEKSGAGCYSNPTLLKVTLKNCEKSIDLSLTKTTDNTTPNVGDNITFTVKVTNAGPDAATGIEVMDELPAGLQFVSSAFFTNNSGVLTSTISNVAANQTITLTYIAKVTGSTAMTNFAQITKTTEKDKDSTPGNGKTTKEDDDDKITITPKVVELLADLSLNKTVSNSTPATGEQITYYVEVKNNGTSNATNVEATDIVPAGLQIISATGGDGITTTGNTVVAKFNQINVGQTATFQIVAKVTATTGTIKNWAEVTKSDQKDPNSTPNNGVDKNENDDDDADITIKQQVCNPTTPLIACANPYICLGESVSIEAIGCNGTIVWSDGQTGNMITVTPTATTTYTAQCKINDNCISGKSNPVQVVVNVIAPPTITSSSTSNVICNGGSVTLTANNCTGKILWSTGATTPSITVSPTAITSYTATCTKLSCVSNKSNVITVTVGTPTAPPTITADNNVVCAGQSVKLTANGCTGTVVWSNGSTGASITFAPTSTGPYSAVCKVGECSSNASTPITITVGGAGSTPTIAATKDGICVGESVTLTASNCTGSLSWSTGATTSSITVSPTSTTSYGVTCSVNNCGGSATKVISVTPKPTAPIVTCGKERICSGESLTFVANGCEGTVTWSTGATGATMVVNPIVTTTYTAICTVNGCASNPSKDAIITVLNQNPPTITASAETLCNGGSVTLTVSNCDGIVLWSTGSTAGTISVTPTVATTYTVKCIVEECSSSASKTINIGSGQTPNAPVIAIASTNPCDGSSILTATGCTGTIRWSNGATTASITVSGGTYTATCSNGCGVSGNSNTLNVPVISIVPFTVTASNETVCNGGSATLTANGCSSSVLWSTGATTASITVTPTATTTYTVTCNNQCAAKATKTINVGNGQTPTAPVISTNKTAVCGNETATLTATGCTGGTITWSNGATGSSISVSAGTYTATCKTDCGTSGNSNAIVINSGGQTPNAPIISTNRTSVCGNETATLIATGCTGGTITWSNGATGSSISVSAGTYTATCKNNCGISGNSNAIIITSGGAGSTPTIAATKDGICIGESVTLTANNCTGTLTWSTGATTSSITVSPTANTTYEVTCSVTGCSGKTSKAITVTPKPATPIVTCGKERICAGESLTFTAHGCEGKVTWSNGATGATMVVTPTTTTTYTAICTVNGCASSPSKDAVITVINQTPPTITASAETICGGGSVTLTASNCDGTVLWSTGSTSGAITVTPTVATTYTVKCIVDECESSASKTINIGGGQTPTAPIISTNKTSVCGNETATLTATGCTGGTITWSNGATGSSITVSAGTYTAICKNDCGTSGNSNAIVIQSGNVIPPTISAPTTALCEPGQVTLTAAGCAGTVVWSNTSTGSSITVSVTTTTTFSAACKTATCESEKSNNITVTVGKPNKPTITGNKETVCAGDAVTLTATGCEGTTVWSNGLTGSSISVTPSNTTDYTAVCKLPQGGCTSDQSNKVTVNVTPKAESPVISCTASRICKGDTLTLNALGCSGSVLWSTGQTAASINVNPAATTVYTAICKVGSCESAPSAAATITVGNPIPPVVTCKNTQICGGSSTQIEAAGCTGTVKWSDGQIGAVITVSPTSITSYSAICDGGTCQSEKSNVITIQVTGSGLKKPTVRDLVNTCPFVTVDLTTGVSSAASSQGGIFVFRTGTTSGSPAVTNPSTAGTGTYYVFEKAGNGCYSEGAKINVNITSCETPINCTTNPATAMAGKDTTVCLSADFLALQGKIGGSATSAKWTTDGKGSFENALSLNTKYNYSNDDVVKGSVKFTLTTNDPDDNGSCVAATSSFTVTLKGVSTVPTIASDKSPNICFGDSVVLTATNAGSYKWSTGATTKSITVKTPGRYTVKLINDGGCASLSSSEIVVKLSDAIATPVVTAITKNNCPATTVNLASSVTSQTKSTGGAFEFHTGSSPSSPMLANASAVGSGTYYVIEKSGTGCYSQASPIIVTIDQCTVVTDTSKVDVSVLIVGSRVELKIGDPVTYTITVKNNSTVKAATNVNVVNVLPKGFTITSTTPGFTAFGTDSLLSVIGNLPAGATKTYTYDAKTTKAGQIINTAKITKLDQIDQILSNNISQWTVECKTCQETCVGLALAADTTRQINGSYNITFRTLIEACGNVKLEGVKVTENLATMFPAPTTFTIVQKPTAGVGSLLKPNDSFNGSTDLNLTIPEGSIVEAGKIDTIKFVINIVPNGKEGPFSTNALVEAIGNTAFGIPQDVSDVSNNGKTVVKESAEPTVVRLYKSPSVGLAKIVSDTTKKANGSYDVTYQLLVKNNGSLTLNDVIVRDTLSKVFKAPATFTVVAAPSKNTSSQLALNSAFNGTTDTRLTLTGSTIAIGKTDTLKFTVNVRPDTLKTFANIAVVSGSGTLTSGTKENVTDLSNAGLNPDAPGSNPTNLNLNSEGGSSIEVPCIGIALYVKDTVRQADSSYNITYKAILKNCGNLNLSSVQVCDTLSKTFTSPAVAKLAVKPTVSAGSLLKVDTSYNGTSKTCMLLDASQLAPNKVDTITWVVNVKLNGNKGPFRNTVIVTAKTPSGQTITDASNAGVNPDPSGNIPTVINFNSLPEALIGISKSASVPKLVTGTSNTYDVTFTFKVKNYGKVAFTGVQIQDNLSVVFGDSIKIDSVKVTADAGLTANSSFTGRGNLINLLVDSLSTLAANTDKNVTLFARLTTTSSKANFENQALVIGKYPTNKSENDLSTNGNDPDPDADGTPKNNSLPTPVKLGDGGPIIPSFSTTFGIAKAAILDTVKNSDGSYNLSYKVIVKNYGTRKLTNIQLSDNLKEVFADSGTYTITQKPILSKNSTLKLNTAFNGDTIITMLKPDSSSLAAGASDTLTFKLRIISAKKGDATYSNSITGIAKDSTTEVKDISQTGLNPDPDGDKNPGNNNLPTVITIKGKTAITDTTNRGKIPQAFSPNNDGKNDLFVIKGINGVDDVEAEIFIYNRWGQLVYQNTDFAKVEGWNGEANNGIILGGKGVGVPDGTYFICVKAAGFWGDKPQVNFITIAR